MPNLAPLPSQFTRPVAYPPVLDLAPFLSHDGEGSDEAEASLRAAAVAGWDSAKEAVEQSHGFLQQRPLLSPTRASTAPVSAAAALDPEATAGSGSTPAPAPAPAPAPVLTPGFASASASASASPYPSASASLGGGVGASPPSGPSFKDGAGEGRGEAEVGSRGGAVAPRTLMYNLYAVLVHCDAMGSTSWGHYIAYVQRVRHPFPPSLHMVHCGRASLVKNPSTRSLPAGRHLVPL